MKTWARIDGGKVTEVFMFDENPHALFDPEWEWIEAPEGTRPGAEYDGAEFTNPPAPEPVEPVDPVDPAPVLTNINVPHFKMRFTAQERVGMTQAAADAANPVGPFIADWLGILDDPRLEYVTLGDPNLTAAMGMLIQAGLLTEERAAIVLKP